MIDTSEDCDTVKPEIEEPVEEVQISEEAQQIAEDAESDAIEESQAEEATPEASAEPSAEEQAAEMKDRLLRALADVENTRRRAARDLEDARKYAASGFAKDLLNVSDNLRRALMPWPMMREGDETVGISFKASRWSRRNSLARLSARASRKSIHWVSFRP